MNSNFSNVNDSTQTAVALKFNIDSSFGNDSVKNVPVNVKEFPKEQTNNPVFDSSSLVASKKISKIYDITREEFVIRRIFDDTTLQNRIIEYMTPDIFTGCNRGIIRGIIAFNNGNKRFPSPQELMIGFPDDAPERNALRKIIEYEVDTVASDVSAKMVKNYFREMLTEKIIIEAAISMKNNKVDNIMDLVKELEKSINFNMDIDVGLSARSDMKEIVRRLNETLKAVPSALYDIRVFTSPDEPPNKDEHPKDNGGWYVGLSLFLGMPNVGKTIMLCNEAAYAYRNGYNVLYVSLEMAEEFIHQRIIANVCQIPAKQVKNHNPDELLKIYETNVIDNKPGNLFVKRMPTTTTVVEIDALIQEIQRTNKIKIDIIFVDYIGIMKPAKRSNTVQNMNMYLIGKEVAEQLRDLGYKYLIPVVTASQLTREGYSNLAASMKDIAGSAAINDAADFMVTIMQDENLKQCSMFMHNILKSRFGQKDVSTCSVVDYSRMTVRSANSDDMTTYNNLLSSKASNIKQFNQGPDISYDQSKIMENKKIKPTDIATVTKDELRSVENINVLGA